MLAASAEDCENSEPRPSQQQDAPAVATDRGALAALSAGPVEPVVSDGPVIATVSMGADSIANVVGGQLAAPAGFNATPAYAPSLSESQFHLSQMPRNVAHQPPADAFLGVLSLVSSVAWFAGRRVCAPLLSV